MRTRAVLLAATLLVAGCSSNAAGTGSGSGSGSGSAPGSEEPAGSPDSPQASGPSDDRTQERDPDRTERTFSARISPITPQLRARMSSSHRPGCPVPLSALRHLELTHVDLDGRDRTGELVVAARYAEDVAGVFERLYDARFPIARMSLVDVYGGDDDRSMAANNTSAYNCRRVAGTDRWSEHAYGGAIDINPVQNPYVQGSSFVPARGAAYVDVPRGRGASADPGVIVAGDVVDRAFTAIGWEWGGRWASSKDYQHFSAGGG